MKKLIALLLVIVMVFALAACTTGGDKPVTSSDPASESGSEPANPDEKALKIGIAVQSISTNPIFINAVQMIQTDCDKNGYTLITTDLVNGAEDIPNALENFVSAGCNIVMIHVLDPDTVATKMEEMQKAGIMVAAYDTYVEGCTYCLMADNYELGVNIGKMAGEFLKKTTGGKGKAAILTYDLTEEFQKRGNGMEDGFYAVCPDAEIVIRTAGCWVDEATQASENVLAAYPDINVIMTLGEQGALASYEVFKAAGKGKDANIGIFTAELTDPGVTALRDGGIYRGTISVELDASLFEMYKRCIEAEKSGKVDEANKIVYFPMVPVQLDGLDEYLAGYEARKVQ